MTDGSFQSDPMNCESLVRMGLNAEAAKQDGVSLEKFGDAEVGVLPPPQAVLIIVVTNSRRTWTILRCINYLHFDVERFRTK